MSLRFFARFGFERKLFLDLGVVEGVFKVKAKLSKGPG